MLVRKSLAFLLVALMALPGYGNPVAMGVVQGSSDATMRGTNLIPGTAVYSGDEVAVGPQGNAQITFGSSSQLILLQNGKAQFVQSGDRGPVRIEMENGFARFRSSSSAPMIAMLGDATIRPTNGEGIAAIKITSPTAALISAEKGSLTVTTPDSTQPTTVPEGMTLNVAMAPQAGGAAQSSGMSPKAKKILVGALIVGAAVAIGVALNQGENSNQPPLSPFQP